MDCLKNNETDIANLFQKTCHDSSILHNIPHTTKLFVNLAILLFHSKIVADFLELVGKGLLK